MSGGGGASASNAAAISQIDPRLYADWQGLNAKAREVANNPYQEYGGKLVADDNMFEDLAQYRTLAAADMGQNTIGDAARTFYGVANDSPTWMDAQQAGPAAQRNAAQIGDVLDVQAERAQAGTVPGGNLSSYMNPYQSQVIDQSNRELDRQRQIVDNQNAASASHAGAFGGSRHGILDAENDRNFQQAKTDNTNSLLQGGYDRATGLLTSDLDRGAGVSTFNAGQMNEAFTGNANRDLAARGADASARQQAMLDAAGATDAMSQFNAGQRQQNQQDYGQRDLAQSNLNLQGAQGLLGAAQQGQDQYLKGAEALGAAGANQRTIDQQRTDAAFGQWQDKTNYPREQLNILSQPFGLIPSNQQSTSNSQSKSAQMGALGK